MSSDGVGEAKRKLSEFMAKRGKRNTRQRDVIVDVFLDAGGHLTLQELTVLVQKQEPGIGFATVYRTMKMLTEAEVAQEHRFDEGQTRYELADAEHHDHLICVSCGRIDEFEDEAIERRQVQVLAQLGWTERSHRHEIYGVCPDCQAAE